MKKAFTTFFLLLTFLFSAFAQNTVSIAGLGAIPYVKNENIFSLDLKEYGTFDFTGTIQPLSLSTEVSIEQLTKFPGYDIMSKMGLDSIKLEATTDGLAINSKLNTSKDLKPLFDALKILAPVMEIKTKIGKGTFELEGKMSFPEPIEMVKIDNPGTVLKYSSIAMGTSAEVGSMELEVTTGLMIKPSSVDPELETYFTFGYDLITQEITGAGSYMTQWVDPFGINTYVEDNSIILNGGALEMGFSPATLTPSNIGIVIKDAILFDIVFDTHISIAPLDKEFGLYASRKDKMTANDMTKIMREGFGLNVPDVFPSCYSLTNSVIKFSPTKMESGEYEMDKGFELSGIAEVCNLLTGDFKYYFDMENEFILHADFDVDAKQFLMNEARKVDMLASAVDKMFNNVEIRKLYIDMRGSLGELNLKGETKVVMNVMGQEHRFSFAATLDPEVIAREIFDKLKQEAPALFNAVEEISKEVTKVASAAATASINTAKAGYDKLGYYAKHATTWKDHATHGRFGNPSCYDKCVPDRVNKLTGPVHEASNKAVMEFYDKVYAKAQRLVGVTPEQTAALRMEAIGDDWSRLMNDLDNKWLAVNSDNLYLGFDKDPSDAKKLGKRYRELVSNKYAEHRSFRTELWKRLLTIGDGTFQIQNRWKTTYFLHQNWTNLNCATIEQEWQSARWELEQVDDTEFFRIKNKAKGTYIHIEHGKVEAGDVKSDWHSAQWEAERVSGTKYFRLKNRWKGTYLNIESGELRCTDIGKGAYSAMWDMRPMLDNINWHSTGDNQPVEMYTLVRIKNRHKTGYLQIEKGPVRSTSVLSGWISARWIIEPSTDPRYVRIKNRWKGTYLNVESGKLQSTAIDNGWQSALWEIIKVPGTPYVKIRNRWKDDWYIHHEWNVVECATIKQDWHSAMWELEYDMQPEPITVSYYKNDGCGAFYRSGVELKRHCGWRKSWTAVLVLDNMSNSFTDYKVLFYDQSAGLGELYRVDAHGNIHRLKTHRGWRKSWSDVSWDSKTKLLTFKNKDGYWERYSVTDSGNIKLNSKQEKPKKEDKTEKSEPEGKQPGGKQKREFKKLF
ncbi:MAG: RICIN domain-containing protein [Bacteroidota bacterium]